MKRMNERVEQAMEKLGLEKTDLHAVDKAFEYIEKEDEKTSHFNHRFAGLRVGNSGVNMPLDLNVPVDTNGESVEVVDVSSDDEILEENVIAVVSTEDKENGLDMALDLNVPLDTNGESMKVVDVSSDDEILEENVIAVVSPEDNADDLKIPEHQVLGKDKENGLDMALDLNVPLDTNGQIAKVVDVSSDEEIEILDKDVIGDALESPEHEVLGKDKENGKDEVARPFSKLWWLLAGDDLNINVEYWADKALRDIKEDIRVRLSETNAVPAMTQAQLPEPVVEQDINDYRRRYLRERNRGLARPNPPVVIGGIGTQKKRLVDELEQFKNSVGLFSEAVMDIKMRTSKRAAEDLIEWQPSIQIRDRSALVVPSLLNLSVKVIAENADSLVSLESIPGILRKKLSDVLCDTRKINAEYFILLIEGRPEEIRVKNCSFLTDGQFEQSFVPCQTENCKVLQLDLCGQVMFDYALRNKLSRSSRSFHCLVIISLKGCLRLTNRGVEVLVRSAPSLLSINLSQCPLLTFEAIICIADYLGSKLRELYIDGCDQMDARMLTPAIKKFIKLEVLSIADTRGVSDTFMCLLVLVCGKSIKELGLANCSELTDASLKAIGDFCTGLCSLDITRLCEVTDLGMEYLANGCRSIQKLKLSETRFSDEAVAAFLEISGRSLVELELNRMHKVGPHTAFSLARRSRKLVFLDISWCRKLSEKALGLIVDSCSSLKLLKLFNCRQITDVFLNGHSNPQVQIVGLNQGLLLDHLNLLEPDQEVFLRYSPLPTSSSYQEF